MHQRVSAFLSIKRTIALLALVGLSWAGCGGAGNRVKRSDRLDSAYRNIQVREAEIEAYRLQVCSLELPPVKSDAKARRVCVKRAEASVISRSESKTRMRLRDADERTIPVITDADVLPYAVVVTRCSLIEIMENWIEEAEAALKGKPSPTIEVVPIRRPPLLDPQGMQAITAPILAVFVWAVEVLQENLGDHPLDPLALLLRLIALALTVRAVIMGNQFWGRLCAWSAYQRYGLAISDQGLMLRTPKCDLVVAREDIVGIREQGYTIRPRGRRWRDVYVITRPQSGRHFLSIPPFFESTPALLAEKLTRWLGVLSHPNNPTYPKPGAMVSSLYNKVASGEEIEGVTAVHNSSSWIKRGPYATVLLGFAILYGYIRLPVDAWGSISPLAPLVLVVTLLVVPLTWIWFTWQNVKPRKGIALILTPAEMVMRAKQQMLRVRWSNLLRVEIRSKSVWSILEGVNENQTLVIYRKNEPEIRYRDVFLDAPLEVVLVLIDSYRNGLLP